MAVDVCMQMLALKEEFQMGVSGTNVEQILRMELLLSHHQSDFLLVYRKCHAFAGDNAFALKKHMMKPYPQHGLTEDKRVYNYRHSRVRRISQNFFSIFANLWCTFRSACYYHQIPKNQWYLQLLLSTTIYGRGRLLELIVLYGWPKTRWPSNTWRQESPAEALSHLAVPSTGHNSTMDAKSVRTVALQWHLLFIVLLFFSDFVATF